MLLETSLDPGDKGRIFYGTNFDGSSYFTDSSGKKSYFYKKNSESNIRTESEIRYFKLNSTNSNYSDKEYLISISQSCVVVLILKILRKISKYIIHINLYLIENKLNYFLFRIYNLYQQMVIISYFSINLVLKLMKKLK